MGFFSKKKEEPSGPPRRPKRSDFHSDEPVVPRETKITIPEQHPAPEVAHVTATHKKVEMLFALGNKEKPSPVQIPNKETFDSLEALGKETSAEIQEIMEYPFHLRELASSLDTLADLLDSSPICDEQTHMLWNELQDTLPGLINAGNLADIRATYIFESFWKFHRLAMKKMHNLEDKSSNMSRTLEPLREQLTKAAEEVKQVMEGQQMKVRTYTHLGQLGSKWRSFINLDGGNSQGNGRLVVLSPALLRKDGTCQIGEHAELE